MSVRNARTIGTAETRVILSFLPTQMTVLGVWTVCATAHMSATISNSSNTIRNMPEILWILVFGAGFILSDRSSSSSSTTSEPGSVKELRSERSESRLALAAVAVSFAKPMSFGLSGDVSLIPLLSSSICSLVANVMLRYFGIFMKSNSAIFISSGNKS